MTTNASLQIRYGSIISYITIAINIILGLIYTPWILQEVGSSNYGLYTLATSLIALFLIDFGMSAAVTRFISNFRAQNNQAGIDSFIGLSIKFYVAICIIIAIILTIVFFNIDNIYNNLTATEIATFKIVFIITAFFVVACFPANICNGILNAYEQYIWLKGSDVINKVGTVIVTIIALVFHGGIFTLVFINGFFNFVTFIAKIIIVAKTTPVKVKKTNISEVHFKDIISFSIWTTVNTVSQQMIFNLIPSVLAMVSNTLAITLYGFANIIEGYVYSITQAINGLFLPKVSREIVNKEDASKVLPLMIRVGRLNQSVVSLLIIGLTVMGKEFVHLWIGDEYSELYYCIMLVCSPYLISASQQIANTSIVVHNKIKYSALIYLISGLLNLIICYFTAQRFGIIGVCATIGSVFFLRIILMNAVYLTIQKINIWRFFRECHIKMLPGFVLAFLTSYAVINYLPLINTTKGWLLFLFKDIIVVICYFVCMWITGWNDYEKSLIKSFIPKIKYRR